MIELLKQRLEQERKDHQETKDFAGRMILELEAKLEKLQLEKEGSLVAKGIPTLKEGYRWSVKEKIGGDLKRVNKSKWLYPSYQAAYVDARLFLETSSSPDCAFRDVLILKESK